MEDWEGSNTGTGRNKEPWSTVFLLSLWLYDRSSFHSLCWRKLVLHPFPTIWQPLTFSSLQVLGSLCTSLKPKFHCTWGWSGNHLRAWHSYWWEHHGESCMIGKRVVFRPSSFLHFRREENRIFDTKTNCLFLISLGTTITVITTFISLLWPRRIPNSLLQCE